jgi:hypothetical protein
MKSLLVLLQLGNPTLMNLLLLELFFLSYPLDLRSYGRGFLCKFLLFTRSFPTLQEGIVRRLLHPEDESDDLFTHEPEDEDGFAWIKKGDEKRFKLARNGETLLTHFEYELCALRNLHLWEPGRTQTDILALCVYRQAILDAFWSRERATVSSNRL